MGYQSLQSSLTIVIKFYLTSLDIYTVSFLTATIKGKPCDSSWVKLLFLAILISYAILDSLSSLMFYILLSVLTY